MTKQTKSLGGLADIQASPPPIPETTDERIDRLEHRLIQVETLLNDVMQQLDRPFRDLHSKQNGKPSQAKLKQAKPPTTPPTLTAEQIKQADTGQTREARETCCLRKSTASRSSSTHSEGF